jgi:hypothetical protein
MFTLNPVAMASAASPISAAGAGGSTTSANAQTPSTADITPVSSPTSAQASPQTVSLQNIVVRVAPPSGDANGSVDIRVAQRAGEIQVTVHTPDSALQANLRQDLPALVISLDRAGFDAQTFITHASSATVATAGTSFDSGSSLGQNATGGQSDASGSGSRNAKDSGTPGNFSGQPSSGQPFSGNQSRDRQAFRWLDQIEE